ncbi:HNH endonuclease [Caballeronia udeis]|uniref:HNH endonuclease n=2 Tax=Caballeronia udeis TaxID=1232866 RepID=A0A158H4I2_9BURK|nr:HNH endonuclease [Caballeronia udeis]
MKRDAEFREVSIRELRRVLDYDPKTGVLRWKVRLCRSVPIGSVAGCIDPTTGYLRIGVFGTVIYAHRIAWALHYGYWPSTLLDHRDRRRTNNQIKNLRLATTSQNQANANRSPNGSGYRGVFRAQGCKKWFAAIQRNGKRHHLGMFTDPGKASEAYQQAARELHGEFAFEGVQR